MVRGASERARHCRRAHAGVDAVGRGRCAPCRALPSDAVNTYHELCWWGVYTSMYDKSQPYSVEGMNADLSPYLARLARKSRGFARCLHAWRRASPTH